MTAITVKRHDPTQINIFVLIPAGLPCRSRLIPIIAPTAVENNTFGRINWRIDKSLIFEIGLTKDI
jgi:hypothetical protein